MKYEVYPKEEATLELTYGLYSEYKEGRPHYRHKLSQKGLSLFWNKQIDSLVNLGLMHWVVKPLC